MRNDISTPKITEFGFAGHKDDTDPHPPKPDQVILCKIWIAHWVDWQPSINRHKCNNHNHNRGYYSHDLREFVECAMGHYVSNGAFIQAAIESGYECEQTRWDNNPHHVRFNMNFRRAEDYFISRLGKKSYIIGLWGAHQRFNNRFPLERIADNYLDRAKTVLNVVYARMGWTLTEPSVVDLPDVLNQHIARTPGLDIPIRHFNGPLSEIEMWIIETVLGLPQIVATGEKGITNDEK